MLRRTATASSAAPQQRMTPGVCARKCVCVCVCVCVCLGVCTQTHAPIHTNYHGLRRFASLTPEPKFRHRDRHQYPHQDRHFLGQSLAHSFALFALLCSLALFSAHTHTHTHTHTTVKQTHTHKHTHYRKHTHTHTLS